MFTAVSKAQLQDFRFSQPHCIRLKSSGMWCHVGWHVVPGVLKDHGACSPRISRHHVPSNCWHPSRNESVTCQKTWVLRNDCHV